MDFEEIELLVRYDIKENKKRNEEMKKKKQKSELDANLNKARQAALDLAKNRR